MDSAGGAEAPKAPPPPKSATGFTFSMLYENIRVKMLSMKIFFPILFVWQFSSEFEKIAIKTTT